MKTEDAFVLGCRVSLRETARLALSDIEAERWSADEIAALRCLAAMRVDGISFGDYEEEEGYPGSLVPRKRTP